MSGTIVLQSHRSVAPNAWLAQCMDSVRAWAAACGFAYRFADDALFHWVEPSLLEKTRRQPVIATDLARLLWCRSVLAEGHDCVLWVDADMLVIDPMAFRLPDAAYAVGREVWVQRQDRRWRCFIKVHNAFLLFRPGNVLLDFYLDTAQRMLHLHGADGMAPQLIGPKLLTALHNIVQMPVCEQAGMISPAVVADVLAGGGAALELFRARSRAAPAAVNLCASAVLGGELDEGQMLAVVKCLLDDPAILAPPPAV